jgi:hypothetical protein
MERIVDPVPVPTDIIRTQAFGPKPANTLVFLKCRASGADIATNRTGLLQFEVEFKSKFRIDGYLQAKHDWYLANTRVSATGMIRLASTTTDCEFLMALDSVDSFIDELDGVLGFKCGFALQIDGLGFFEESAGIDLVCDVCAYVLVFEPQVELPPSGRFGQPWRYDPHQFERAFSQVGQSAGATGRIARLSVTPPADRGRIRPRNCE